MAWLRLYDDILDDPKVQNLPSALFKNLINLWCVAKRCEGIIPPVADLAFRLRMSEKQVSDFIGRLQEAGFIDVLDDGTMTPHNWEARQFVSDNVTLRVRKHREKHRGNVSGNARETLHETHQSRAETEQSRTDSPKPPDGFDEFWSAYPRKTAKGSARGAFRKALTKSTLPSILAALERQKPQWSDPKFIPHPATWLNAERWLDEAANVVPINKRPEDIQAGRLETYRKSGYWGSDWGPCPTSEGVAAQ